MSPRKVLITGATGFLGQHLVKDLLAKGDQVSILARKTSDLSPFANQSLQVFHGDITDRLALLHTTEQQDVVFHLAGLIAYKRADRKAMEEINVKGTANVVDACITNKVSQLLHLSSVVAIGASPTPNALNEDSEFNLSQFDLGYFETKRQAEQIIQKAVSENGLNAYMINPSTIYGPGDATKGSRKTQVKVALGKFPFYPPGGVNVVHVDDVIAAIHLCLEKGKPGRRYIVGGDNIRIKELFEIIAQTAGVPSPKYPIPRFALGALGFIGDQLRALGKETPLSSETAITASYFHWFDSERAKKELGYNPRPSSEAIQASVQWMLNSGLVAKQM